MEAPQRKIPQEKCPTVDINDIPNEILKLVFNNLTVTDRILLSRTYRKWHDLIISKKLMNKVVLNIKNGTLEDFSIFAKSLRIYENLKILIPTTNVGEAKLLGKIINTYVGSINSLELVKHRVMFFNTSLSCSLLDHLKKCKLEEILVKGFFRIYENIMTLIEVQSPYLRNLELEIFVTGYDFYKQFETVIFNKLEALKLETLIIHRGVRYLFTAIKNSPKLKKLYFYVGNVYSFNLDLEDPDDIYLAYCLENLEELAISIEVLIKYLWGGTKQMTKLKKLKILVGEEYEPLEIGIRYVCLEFLALKQLVIPHFNLDYCPVAYIVNDSKNLRSRIYDSTQEITWEEHGETNVGVHHYTGREI